MIAGNSISLRLFIVFTTIALCGMGRWAKADGGGNVMPASARPLGYSLTEIAADTALFNTGPRTADTVPDVPFQLLYVPFNSPLPTQNTFTVTQGTHFYVPVFFADDSPPVIGDFPGDVSDRQADADYLLDADEIGASLEIEVDGKVTDLGAPYVVGTTTDPLQDGGGTHYVGTGVFLTPMSRGTHTVTVRGIIAGAAWQDLVGGPTPFEFTYTIIVR